MPLPWIPTSGKTVSAEKLLAVFNYLYNRTLAILNDQILGPIDPEKIGPSLSGDANAKEDFTKLDNRLKEFENAPMGIHNLWSTFLPVAGAPMSVVDAGGLKFNVAAQGSIEMFGHDLYMKAVSGLGIGGANGDPLLPNKCYALRIKPVDLDAVPPDTPPNPAHFTEGAAGADSVAFQWDCVALEGNSEWENAAVTSLTDGRRFSIGASADLMGAALHFLSTGSDITVPFANGGAVYLDTALSSIPSNGERTLVRYDQSARREAAGVGGGPSTPQNALVGIIVTDADSVYFFPTPNLGGSFKHGHSNTTELDWSGVLNKDTNYGFAIIPPFAGARLKSIRGLAAIADSATAPTHVTLVPLSHWLTRENLEDGTVDDAGLGLSYDGNMIQAIATRIAAKLSDEPPAPAGQGRFAAVIRIKVIMDWE